jgi:anti-sigma regulatory factor (Ser/Thr protein kinase)
VGDPAIRLSGNLDSMWWAPGGGSRWGGVAKPQVTACARSVVTTFAEFVTACTGVRPLAMDLLASTRFRREPAAVPAARAFVRRALARLEMSADARDRLVLAAAEAFNNVVLHAECDSFAVSISRDDVTCVVDVTDEGHGFYVPTSFDMPPASDVGHRGLAIMQALVDRVRVASSPTGTEVMLAQALSTNGASPLRGLTAGPA